MTDTEELITAALRKQADRAPHSGPIRFALDKPRRRRVPGLITAIVAVLVVSGISVPMVLLQSKPAPSPPTLEDGIPLAVKPTYLPAGFVESRRHMSHDGDVQRRDYERTPDPGPWGSMSLQVFGPNSPDFARCGAHVPANKSQPAEFWVMNGWCVELQTPSDLAPAEVAKIVESVRPDGTTVVKSPVRLTARSTPMRVTSLTIGRGPTAGIEATVPGSSGPSLDISIGPTGTFVLPDVVVLPDAPPVTKDIGNGQTMVIMFRALPGELTQQQQDQIVRGIVVQQGDYSWLGK